MKKSTYARSILQKDQDEDYCECYICGGIFRKEDMARHEPFNAANRQKSKEYGLWVLLCPSCHDKCHYYPQSYGNNLKREAQSKAMLTYGWDYAEWIERFGKNFL